MAGIQFGANGEIVSNESADTMRLGASQTNPFNFQPSTQLGIPSADLSAAANGNEDVAARAAGVSIRSGSGAASVNIGGVGGFMEKSHDVAQVNMAHTSNGESGILATARRDGTPRPADELRDTDMVTIDGIETSVAVARRLGFITKSRTGILENVSPEQLKEATGEAEAARAAEQAAKDQAEAQAATEAAKLSPEAEQAAQMLATKVDQNTQIRALIELADAGQVTERAINAAASQAGMDPSEMKAALAKALDGYGGQVTSFLTERGASPDEFFRWAKTTYPTDYKAALIGHVQDRNVAAWGALADRYMVNLDRISPDAILSANFENGITARMDYGTRAVILDIPGHGSMRWSAAVRAGLVGPHRRG
jgi:hypothetical protein